MVLLNSIIITTLIVFGVFDNYTYAYTRDKWDHAVNSKAELKKALESNSTRIEADVTLGKYYDESVEKGEVDSQIPIMGQPPAINSDLSLQQFLSAWSQNMNKTVKLDFKSIEAFTTAIPIMEKSFKNFTKPIRQFWLHADILPGKGDVATVEAETFIGHTMKNFPDSMLSLGWTTKRNDNIGDKYTIEHLWKIVGIFQKSKPDRNQRVTFAVRASLVGNSIEELYYLLGQLPPIFESSLTIWCSDPGDVINYLEIVKMVGKLGFNRVFLDLPDKNSEDFFNEYRNYYN